jgi:hypothetical protein
MKQNLKLATSYGREAAWKQESDERNDWLNDDTPTLIIGLSMSSGKIDFSIK